MGSQAESVNYGYPKAKRSRPRTPKTEDEIQAGYRKIIANSESESEFDSRIVQLAGLNGWKTFHVYDSRKSEAGWPDRLFTRRPDFFAAELKKQNGKVSAAQQWWIDELRACGWDVRVWKPSDWEEIVERLARKDY